MWLIHKGDCSSCPRSWHKCDLWSNLTLTIQDKLWTGTPWRFFRQQLFLVNCGCWHLCNGATFLLVASFHLTNLNSWSLRASLNIFCFLSFSCRFEVRCMCSVSCRQDMASWLLTSIFGTGIILENFYPSCEYLFTLFQASPLGDVCHKWFVHHWNISQITWSNWGHHNMGASWLETVLLFLPIVSLQVMRVNNLFRIRFAK